MIKHFVTFESPGTFVHETTTKPIDSWSLSEAVKMSSDISERHGAKPFAFYFTIRKRRDDELDSKLVKTSGRYFLGGKVETYDEVMKRNAPNEDILRSNMRGNNIKRIAIVTNGYKSTHQLDDNDMVISEETIAAILGE